MKGIRSITTATTFAALLLVGTVASAGNFYTFSGKFTSNRGRIINIPVVGNTTCGTLTIKSGPNTGMLVTATMRTMTRGANVQTTMPGTMTSNTVLDLGCVKHAPDVLVETTGAGEGGQFYMPVNAWYKPLPGYTAAVEVKYAAPVVQLATSFKIAGPLLTKTTPPAGTMYGPATMTSTSMTKFPAANFRLFRAGAWTSQTGRTSEMFTWCFGEAACTNIGQGDYPIIVKYEGGAGENFGGTMAYVITTGANTSSLGVGTASGGIGFAILAGMGSQPTGRGYAEYLTDMLAMGPLWAGYSRDTVTRPNVGMQKLVTDVGLFLGNIFPAAINYNYGFPFTTNTVLVRNTGLALGNPASATLTAVGHDSVTTMGEQRNIGLVAGALAHTSLDTDTGNMGQMTLTLPEPGAAAQLLAGALGLLAIAGWRARRNR